MTDYYDVIIGLIPLTVGGVTALLTLFGVSLSLAVTSGAILTFPLLGHAMFVNAPESPTPLPGHDSQTQTQINSAD